ncbi:MAG: radical SAM protein [Thermodesulfobacteriota bacterium]
MNRPARENHPCFNVRAKGTCSRVHLPVAPDCNIKCNYCNRKYACVNESRPGVTGMVLTPEQAVGYLERIMERVPQTTVAGIAGPGDAFANPQLTLDTLANVRRRFPDLLLCLATNGLGIGPYIHELAKLDVSHVTVTVNAVDPAISNKIYAWVRDGKVVHRGISAAALLLERQLDAIASLKAHGMVVKVNTIVVPGINDAHVPHVARKMAELGVDIQNCMTMYPTQGTRFAGMAEPTPEVMRGIRAIVERIIPQMKHCTRCRADAVGLLGEDRSAEFRDHLPACGKGPEPEEAGCTPATNNAVPFEPRNGACTTVSRPNQAHACGGCGPRAIEADPDGSPDELTEAGGLVGNSPERPYVAVATMEGALVNQHLGEAWRFQIWTRCPEGYELVEVREAPEPGTGIHRWLALAETLRDCRAVLVAGIGETPRQVLTEHDIVPIEMSGFIKIGLDAVYLGTNPGIWRTRRQGCAKGAGCSGDGGGCG